MGKDIGDILSEKDRYLYRDERGKSIAPTKDATHKVEKTAIACDDYMLRRGEEIAKGARMNKAGIAVPPRADNAKAFADWNSFLYEPSVGFHEHCDKDSQHRRDFLQQLATTVEFQELHQKTMFDPFAAELAARQLSQKYGKAIIDEQTGERKENPKEILDDVSDAVDEGEQIAEGLGFGGDEAGDGSGNVSQVDIQKQIAIMEQVKSNKTLRKIFERAGVYRRAAQSMQRTRQVRGGDQRAGIEQGGELHKLVASERLRLVCGVPEIEDYAAYRLLNNAMSQKEFKSPEHIGRGPIVMVVDESGSMYGDRIIEAKAMTLAMAWIAKNQNRWFAAVAFAADSTGRWLIVPPEEQKTDKLVEWLTMFISGGTRHYVLTDEVPSRWCELMSDAGENGEVGKADIVTITDANFGIDPRTVEDFNAWRTERNIAHTAIAVGGASIKGSQLANTTDDSYEVAELGVGNNEKVVEAVFESI